MREAALLSLGTKAGFTEVQDYLRARGWQRQTSRREYASIFRKEEDGQVHEALIPLDRTLGDYGDAMLRAAQRVSLVEHRDVESVLRDFVSPRRDILRFALDGQQTADGSIKLPNGFSLVNGVKKALLASACSAIRPRKFHPRMTLADAESFLRESRLGQPEIGSFVLVVETPSFEVVGGDAPTATSPLPRRASEHLMRAVSRIERSLRAGAPEALLGDEAGEPIVSSNLCSALVEMMPADESADLAIKATWAPVLPVPQTWPSAVRLDRSTYEKIEWIGQQLRPPPSDREAMFVGNVAKLAGQPGESGKPEGEVHLQVITEDEELLRVSVVFGADDYQKAGEAHLKNKFVSIRGTLHRGWRVHELRSPTHFHLLEDE